MLNSKENARAPAQMVMQTDSQVDGDRDRDRGRERASGRGKAGRTNPVALWYPVEFCPKNHCCDLSCNITGWILLAEHCPDHLQTQFHWSMGSSGGACRERRLSQRERGCYSRYKMLQICPKRAPKAGWRGNGGRTKN